jgi:hypothetical protein
MTRHDRDLFVPRIMRLMMRAGAHQNPQCRNDAGVVARPYTPFTRSEVSPNEMDVAHADPATCDRDRVAFILVFSEKDCPGLQSAGYSPRPGSLRAALQQLEGRTIISAVCRGADRKVRR